VRETRLLLINALGEGIFWKAYTIVRQLQNAPEGDLDRQEKQKRLMLAPVLGDRLKHLELFNQLIFMEDSMK